LKTILDLIDLLLVEHAMSMMTDVVDCCVESSKDDVNCVNCALMKVKLKSVIARNEIHAVSHRYRARGNEMAEEGMQAGCLNR
jgi:hypothetical protein